jgi:hypothetical protein
MASDLVKVVVASGVALAVGLALGGLGPRAEARALRTRLEAMTDTECRPSRVPSELAGVLQGRPWADGREAPKKPAVVVAQDGPGEEAEAPTADPPAFDDVDIQIGEGQVGEDGAFDRDQMDEGLDVAREAMELRSRAAWRALEEQAQPSEAQRVVIEDAVATMNRELVDVADAFAQSVGAGEVPQRRDMMVFAANALETMIATEDTIFETLTPEQRAQLDEQVLDPTAYVDASIIDVLQAIEAP